MKWLLIIFAHLLAIALLLWIGLLLNDVLNDYAGVVSVFSFAVGLYTTVLSLLYQRNRLFYFFVNRLWLKISRTHTYWLPSFDFELSSLSSEERSVVFQQLWEMVRQGRHGKAEKKTETVSTHSFALDNLFIVVFRLEDATLHVHFDRKLLVPSHLYDGYRQRLARLADDIAKVVRPVHVRCGLQVSFADGVTNPYYGFFVNRVPPDLLQDFQVSFLLDRNSTCRIEAGKDHVSIEGTSLQELFEAANQVLALRALPDGVA